MLRQYPLYQIPEILPLPLIRCTLEGGVRRSGKQRKRDNLSVFLIAWGSQNPSVLRSDADNFPNGVASRQNQTNISITNSLKIGAVCEGSFFNLGSPELSLSAPEPQGEQWGLWGVRAYFQSEGFFRGVFLGTGSYFYAAGPVEAGSSKVVLQQKLLVILYPAATCGGATKQRETFHLPSNLFAVRGRGRR